ncbi:MAG: hypothetical protein ACTSRZ_07635 [Promethearchaeota archaeon]
MVENKSEIEIEEKKRVENNDLNKIERENRKKTSIATKAKIRSILKDIIRYFLFFLIVPIIGTQMHELGHYIVALALDCNPTIRYAYCSHGCSVITNDQYFIFITMGPLATWIQCLIGFSFLIIYRKINKERIENGEISWNYLILLAFASFCARFVFNAAGYFLSNSQSLDEWKMENYLEWPHGTLIYGFAIVGAIILLYNIIILPKQQRYKLLIGALLGSIAGYGIWYYWLGPILMP